MGNFGWTVVNKDITSYTHVIKFRLFIITKFCYLQNNVVYVSSKRGFGFVKKKCVQKLLII